MSRSIGLAFLARGGASLAIDLPLHGARGDGAAGRAGPVELLELWRTAVGESQLALHYLRARSEVDAGRVAVVGYSLGSFLATLIAAEDAAGWLTERLG